MSTRVKICGVTRVADAELAAELGAWAVGMIFHPASPRACSLEEAQRISAMLRRRPTLCAGVWVNAPLEEISRVQELLGLDLVQLHGDEGPSFCAEVARRTGARVIKAVGITGASDIRDLERFHTDLHLADTGGRQVRGGTGESFDWALLGRRRSTVPLVLSGGLNPGNVAAGIATVHPYAVDVASATEASPGIKDPERLRALFDAVADAVPVA